MNVDTVTVRENISVEVVLRYLRSRGELPEHTHSLFVVDRSDRAARHAAVSTGCSSPSLRLRVGQIMERDQISFLANIPGPARSPRPSNATTW
ncbi:MAG: hypothetical protein MZW92_09680 [Comamonadaceae bacterium]|nr:hypothetical protein [Comamonadaceae bacterium]